MSWLDKLFEWLTPAQSPADTTCVHCRGLGYDSSGYTCTCVEEKNT